MQMVVNVSFWYEKIKVLRISRNWSQAEAANFCGTNQKGFWLWESGKSYPRRNSRKTIARAFGVPEEEIFGKEERA
jgi:transcriptional regulator with XRE-family HTH domain